MLKKLLKNLPFNPSLIDQVPDYKNVIKREKRVRLYALLVFFIAVLVELVIIWRPPQPTITSSSGADTSGTLISCSRQLGACVSNEITVRNATGSITDANGTTAKPGDHLVYTLITRNLSSKPITYKIAANFNNALSYSWVYSLYGGSIDNGIVHFQAQTIAPKNLEVQQVEFVVDSPVPNTPESSVDHNFYNSKMTVTYGNSVSVKVPLSITKFFEMDVNNLLPFSSPAVALTVIAIILVVMLFFIAQCNLAIKELDCIKDDYLDKD
jgi:hypothetical protein